MKPRKKFRSRPKKTGAKKKKRILSQKKRLLDTGHKQKDLDKLTVAGIRELLKKTAEK